MHFISRFSFQIYNNDYQNIKIHYFYNNMRFLYFMYFLDWIIWKKYWQPNKNDCLTKV